MAEKTKNLCAQIPASLHEKVRSRQQESGKTLNEYMTELITNYYENQKGTTNMDNTRTLAVQIDEELFDRLDEYLKKNNLKKRRFITELIQKVLDEADAAAQTETSAPAEAPDTCTDGSDE